MINIFGEINFLLRLGFYVIKTLNLEKKNRQIDFSTQHIYIYIYIYVCVCVCVCLCV